MSYWRAFQGYEPLLRAVYEHGPVGVSVAAGTWPLHRIGNWNLWIFRVSKDIYADIQESESVSSLTLAFHRRLLSILRHLYSSGVFDYCDQEALSTSDFTPKQWVH